MSDPALIPDLEAREQALSPARSFIVQAPAGSGKTELLIQRYLGLLATVNEPEEIVAITFTRKAAAEMRERVINALAQAIAGEAPGSEPGSKLGSEPGFEPNSGHQRRTLELARAALTRDGARGWRIIDGPARLRIQTIDSLCAALTRQMPLLSKFGSQPESIEDAGALYVEAARATVELIEAKDPAADFVERLLVHLDNNIERVEELLIEMLRRRDHWLRHVMANERAGLERALAAERRAVLDQVQALLPLPERGELLAIANYSLGNRGEALLAAFPGGDDVQGWAALADVLLTSNGTWRARVDKRHGFPAGDAGKTWKDRLAAFIAALAGERLRTALADTRRLPPAAYTDAQWQLLEAITGLLKRAVAQLKLVFQSRGQVDFTEVSQRAVLALEDAGGPTDLALRLDYQIRHLLIDEFQDTSISQFELVARLTAGWMPDDGRTLFAVGDPMQSIYRFREAEVGLFLKARAEGIGTVVLAPLELSANFRSQAGIVDWVNQAFRQVMPEREDIGSGAVAYTESQAVHPRLEGDAVEIHPLFAGGDRGNVGEAAAVANIVAAIAAAGAKHGIGQSTAILVRGRNHLREIVPQLKRAGLAFRAIEIDRLDDRPVVQDLLALTRALAHRGDRLAWLAVLRAPWCGLALADLHAIAGSDFASPQASAPFAQGGGERSERGIVVASQTGQAPVDPLPQPLSSQSTVWELMHDPARLAALGADARLRLARVRPVFAAALAGRQRSSLRDAVEGCWLALGGPACSASATDLEDAEAYLDHLESKEEAGAIADFHAFEQSLDQLYALPDMAAGDDAVQIMTMYKAKGLEFDHVIVPGLGRVPPAAGKQLFLWMERPANPDASNSRSLVSGTNLLLAPIEETGAEDNPIYAWIKQLTAEKASHEDGRLLYVAATRAKQRLHLLGETRLVVEDGAQAARNPDARSLLAKLWPVVSGEFQRTAATATVASAIEEAGGDMVPDQSLRRLVSAWSMPEAPPSLAWTAPGETVHAQDDIEYSWAGETARHVGSVVHRWLQKIAEDELEGWGAARIQSLRAGFNNELAARGVAQAQLAAAAERVANALASALADPRGRWLLGPQQDAKNEYRLTAVIEGETRNLVIDRSFTGADGKRWIVDYKASGHEGTDIEGFLDREQERYREQLENYAKCLMGRGALLGLYFPLLSGWREWGPGFDADDLDGVSKR